MASAAGRADRSLRASCDHSPRFQLSGDAHRIVECPRLAELHVRLGDQPQSLDAWGAACQQQQSTEEELAVRATPRSTARASDKVAVAQASSLLYRRFPIGRASPVLNS